MVWPRSNHSYARVDTADDEEAYQHPTTHHRSNSDSSATEVELSDEDVEKSTMLGTLKHYTGQARRRRRPLMVITVFGAVAVFAVLIFGSFAVYSRHLPGKIGMIEDPSAASPLGHSEKIVYFDDPEHTASNGRILMPGDRTHISVPIRKPLPKPVSLLGPHNSRPPLDVLVEYYTTGHIKHTDASKHQEPNIDIVLMFVNATSPFFYPAWERKMNIEGLEVHNDAAKHWRDNGELRGSMRSAAMALGPNARTIHMITGAYDVPENRPELERVIPDDATLARLGVNTSDIVGWTAGQIPDWLDWDNRANVKHHAHPDIFRLPRDDDGRLPDAIADVDEDEWREKALPTFNSFAIESRVGWLDGLADNFIFSNDDMFILHDLTRADWHHPLLGTAIRLEPEMGVTAEVKENLLQEPGELGGLQHGALLVEERFPGRRREYLHHMPKSFTRAIAQEAAVMYPSAFTTAATRSFRMSKRGRADIEMAIVMSHVQIERWREALLWSYIVAKIGGSSGTWGADAREAMRDLLKDGEHDENGNVVISKRKRSSLDDIHRIERNAGWEPPAYTQNRFTSMDGHIAETRAILDNGEQKRCVFSINECLPKGFFDDDIEHDATDVFRRVAFEMHGCGDCLIDALINKSGRRSLSAFLPDASAVYYPPLERKKGLFEREEPMLPLTPTWQEGDFSMASNVRSGQDAWKGFTPRSDGGVSMLQWTVKLLSRYSYTYARTHARFFMVHHEEELKKHIKEIEAHAEVALLCFNDDQPDKADDRVKVRFQKWMKSTFGGHSQYVRYERDDAPSWNDDDEDEE